MNPVTTAEWTEQWGRMSLARKEEALFQLQNYIKDSSEDIRKVGTKFLKGVRIRQSTSPIISAIEEYLRETPDDRGIIGYISKPIAISKGLVAPDISYSSWANLVKQITKQVPTFRLHDARLPNPDGQAGARAKLYVTDECDVASLFNSRARLYDPNSSPSDAKAMVNAIINSIDFSVVGIGSIMAIRPKVLEMKHPLFPPWKHGIDDGLYHMFITSYLIPALSEQGYGDWKGYSSGRSIGRVA